MKALLFANEDEIRREVRRQVALSIPADCVDEVVDLAFHGASEAMSRLFAVGETAGSFPVARCAITIGFGILRHSCDVHEQAAEKLALAEGNPVHTGRVRP